MQCGLGTLHWSLHLRKCTHKCTWHCLLKIRSLVYFLSLTQSSDVDRCQPVPLWVFRSSAAVQSHTTRWQYIHKQDRTLSLCAGRKWDAISRAWNQLSCYFPLLLCLLYFFLSPPPLHKPTAYPTSIVMDHRKNIVRSPTQGKILPNVIVWLE